MKVSNAREFTQIRENKKDILTFGLYPTWQRYIPHVSMYLRDLAKCFVDKMTASPAEAASNEGKKCPGVHSDTREQERYPYI